MPFLWIFWSKALCNFFDIANTEKMGHAVLS